MKKLSVIAPATLLTAIVLLWPEEKIPEYQPRLPGAQDKLQTKHQPNDHFFLQRGYPDFVFDLSSYEKTLKQVKGHSQLKNNRSFQLYWELEGPSNIGGRINTVEVHPLDQNIMYAGCSAGGIFKTTDGGANWFPVFDSQVFLAIGAIAIDPDNPDIVYAGTGDPNISGHPVVGDGIYKSTDAGATWTHIGLADERIISRIAVHPLNTSIIYASAMGLPFEKNNYRGLYKSTDAGNSWNQVLFISDSTGVIDLLIDPSDPDIVYAAGWDRIRNNKQSLVYGPNAKIYKTTDGGLNWNILSNGLPTGDHSRIGLSMSGSNPDVIFAQYVGTSLDLEGLYKSTDGGNNWSAVDISGLPSGVLGGFGWYFGKLRVSPYNDNEIYILGVDMHRTLDGGSSWQMVVPPWYDYEVHADKHDLVFLDPNNIIIATDGGLYKTTDHCDTWADFGEIPNTQFYRIALNPHQPGTYYGGAQDNGTTSGNAGIINQWPRIFGGDGFQTVFNPDNPDIFYVETQWGNIWYTDDGGWYWDDANYGIDNSDRVNWDAPYLMSHHDPYTFYTGTHRIYKSDGYYIPDWYPVSGDLTDGNIYGSSFHTISTLSESPVDVNVVYAGTSDGNVWRSLNEGSSWNEITPGLPNRYVTDIKASRVNSNVVFVAHSGYKDNDQTAHIHLSEDQGNTWKNIDGNLPPLPVNDIAITTYNDSIVFVATDGGVYYTLDQGNDWKLLGENLPVMLVYNIAVDEANNKLIAGTFARSMWSIAIDSLFMDQTIDPGPEIGITAISGSSISAIVFPNPASEKITVKINSKLPCKAILYDESGRAVKEMLITVPAQIIDLSGLPNGIYLLNLNNGKGSTVEKVVKK